LEIMGSKGRGRKEKPKFVEGVSLLSQGRLLKERPQVSTRMVEKKGQTAEADIAEGVLDAYVLTASIDNTFTNEGWILDSGSVVHVCSLKEMFNSFIAKEEETIKIVDDSAYEAIVTGTVNVTCRNGIMHALETV